MLIPLFLLLFLCVICCVCAWGVLDHKLLYVGTLERHLERRGKGIVTYVGPLSALSPKLSFPLPAKAFFQ